MHCNSMYTATRRRPAAPAARSPSLGLLVACTRHALAFWLPARLLPGCMHAHDRSTTLRTAGADPPLIYSSSCCRPAARIRESGLRLRRRRLRRHSSTRHQVSSRSSSHRALLLSLPIRFLLGVSDLLDRFVQMYMNPLITKQNVQCICTCRC